MNYRFKKIISVILLYTLIFNLGGKLAIHQYLVLKSDRFYEKQISSGLYNIKDLTEVKIPVNMPGIADAGYVKIFGAVRFANAAYNYVKMRVTSTAIYLMCVPNYHATHLCNENIIHAENISDIPVPHKEHVPYSKLSLIVQSIFAFQNLKITVPVRQSSALSIEPNTGWLEHTLEVQHRPPKSLLV